MGCCQSLFSVVDPNHKNQSKGISPLKRFIYSDLNIATQNFSQVNIISESGKEASDIVFKGRLEILGFVAVKKYKYMAWPDPNQFLEEAQRVGNLRHKRVINLIGYCCDGDERLLVAKFLPKDTLAQRLFHQKSQTMEWVTRLRIAYSIAEALHYCNIVGFASYNNLSPYTILFDEDGNACLSCFGLMKEIKDDQRTTGSVNPESVIFRFGTILLDLLTGKQIPPTHALEMIHGKRMIELIDLNLHGRFNAEEATLIFKLASQCLRCEEDMESLNTKDLVTTLEALQTKTNARVPSYDILEMTKHKEVSWNHISPLGEACLRVDLKAIHRVMVTAEYEDDKEAVEFTFEEWIQETKYLQVVQKRGDQAFVEKDFEIAIEYYSHFIEGRRMVYPSVYARRSLCYLFCNQPERALRDGMYAQEVFPGWPTAFYLQSVALSKLNMNSESSATLKEAALLEAKRKHHAEES